MSEEVPEIKDSSTSDVPAETPEKQETPEVKDAPEPEKAEPEQPEEESETQDESPEPPKKSKGVQKRIDELVRQREEYRALFEQERQERARMLDMMRMPQQRQEHTGKPELSQFENHEDYLEALSDWKVSLKLDEERRQREAQERQREAAQKQAAFRERLAQAADKFEDFHEVVTADVSISEAVGEAIKDSDYGPELMYFFGKNPTEARRISALNPVAAIREIGRLESRFQEASKPKPKPVSNAPEPVKPLGGKEVASKRPEDMPMDEYIAWRRGKS